MAAMLLTIWSGSGKENAGQGNLTGMMMDDLQACAGRDGRRRVGVNCLRSPARGFL
jgi:hypothetical protein